MFVGIIVVLTVVDVDIGLTPNKLAIALIIWARILGFWVVVDVIVVVVFVVVVGRVVDFIVVGIVVVIVLGLRGRLERLTQESPVPPETHTVPVGHCAGPA